MTSFSHTPVLLEETLDLLNLRAGKQVIDCTLGLGGHSLEILKKIGATGKLMAFEQDGANLEFARERLTDHKNVIFVHSNFETLKEAVKAHGFKPDAILFDLGLSSPHVDDPERGFSFQKDGPLDMRYDKRQPLTAAHVISAYTEEKLADIFFHYGEERRSRLLAKKIVGARKSTPFKTTLQLADFIAAVLGRKGKIHPATLVFQGLRIFVNRELEVLKSALEGAIELLAPGGRIAVISYHSLEDRLVKNTFRYYTQTCICPKELPICQCNFQKKLYLLTKKPIIPSGIEVQRNPRARSAKLRAAERI